MASKVRFFLINMCCSIAKVHGVEQFLIKKWGIIFKYVKIQINSLFEKALEYNVQFHRSPLGDTDVLHIKYVLPFWAWNVSWFYHQLQFGYLLLAVHIDIHWSLDVCYLWKYFIAIILHKEI